VTNNLTQTKKQNFIRDGYPAFITFLSGATAGMVAAVFTHPFDVLKTKQQVAAWQVNNNNTIAMESGVSSVSTGGNSGGCVNGTCSDSLHIQTKWTLSTLYRSGGVSALFRGLSMRLATVIPASAIMVTIYEAIKKVDVEL